MPALTTILHAVAGFVLFFELPIPIYWIVLHPFNSFWRNRARAAILIAGTTAWFVGGVLLWFFRAQVISPSRPRGFLVALGFTLIAVEAYIFLRVKRELGGRRLVGLAELTGTGQIRTDGLYAYVRHPRYTGMFCAVAGAALIAGTPRLWGVLVPWTICALLVIRLEERELESRFGEAYTAYRRRVPAFVPLPSAAANKQ